MSNQVPEQTNEEKEKEFHSGRRNEIAEQPKEEAKQTAVVKNNNEEDIHSKLKSLGGDDVDFGKPTEVRDALEQTASQLQCNKPTLNAVLSDYLGALQKPNVSPEEMIIETNKLKTVFQMDAESDKSNAKILALMDTMKDGVAVHFDKDQSMSTMPEEKNFKSPPPPDGPAKTVVSMKPVGGPS